jgi:hypothetical protein
VGTLWNFAQNKYELYVGIYKMGTKFVEFLAIGMETRIYQVVFPYASAYK